MHYRMNYEARPACYGGDRVDADDPVYRSFDRWVKAGRPEHRTPKRNATAKPKGAATVTRIDFEDPQGWMCEIGLARERLAQLAGA